MAEDIVESGATIRAGHALYPWRRRELGRKLWVTAHHTIGLFLGGYIVVAGLAGSIIAFRTPIDEWLNASIMRVEVPAQNAYVVGILAIFIFVQILVGLSLWWSRKCNWRQALTIKWGATPERIAYDVHKTFGLYLGAVLMVLLFTGISMIFKPQTRSLVSLFSSLREQPQNVKSTPIPGQAPLGLDAAAAITDTVFPDGRLHWILLPSGPKGVYVAGKQADREPNRFRTSRNVAIDQYSGQVLHVQDPKDFTSGETFLDWIYPLHCGEAFGNAGRAFIVGMGLVPLSLYVTGFLRWRWKRRAPR